MKDMSFKKLGEKDRREMERVYVDTRYKDPHFKHKNKKDSWERARRRCEFWFRNPRNHYILGLFLRKKLIGFVVLADWITCDYTLTMNLDKINKKLRSFEKNPNKACMIESINIVKKHQDKGYGRILSDELFKRVRDSAFTKRKKYSCFIVSTGTRTKGYTLISKMATYLGRNKIGHLWNNFYLLDLKKI
ncbi:MAG: GNAT family N-acetyltransferase [archaeon]|nr:MAG: GNAT family N-acetyltransferase [archaeon]